MKLNRLVPTYGNWGGPGWSGGEWNDDPGETKWGVVPIDEMDNAFKRHDWIYQKMPYFRAQADMELACTLVGLRAGSAYGEFYRVCACVIFFLLSVFWR